MTYLARAKTAKGKIGRASSATRRRQSNFFPLAPHEAIGIEAAIAATLQDYRPIWALANAEALANLPVLGGIEALSIVGSNNPQAVAEVTARWRRAGREVLQIETAPPRADGADP